MPPECRARRDKKESSLSERKPRITIVGLGLIGGSIGLALRQAGAASAVVGHDREPSASNRAKHLGAVDKTDWNLVSACESADLVILSIPVGAVETTMKALGPYLRPGCVVLDTSSLKGPVLQWAADVLPAGVHFVGGNPIVGANAGGLEAARADLFRNRVFCLTPTAQADGAAVKLVIDLVAILGAAPLFVDAAEHDGMLAAVDHLPVLVSLALLETVARHPTWRELRKVAGASLEIGTQLAAADPAGWAGVFGANRENLVRWLDEFSATLGELRQHLIDDDQLNDLARRFESADEERNKWLADRARNLWEAAQASDLPKRNMLADMFLGGLAPRRPRRGK